MFLPEHFKTIRVEIHPFYSNPEVSKSGKVAQLFLYKKNQILKNYKFVFLLENS